MNAALKHLLPSEAEVAIGLYKERMGGDGWIYLDNGHRWRRIKWPEPALVTKAIAALRKWRQTSADSLNEPEWHAALEAAKAYLGLEATIRFYHRRETDYGAPLRQVIGTTLMKAFPETYPEERDKVAEVLTKILAA